MGLVGVHPEGFGALGVGEVSGFGEHILSVYETAVFTVRISDARSFFEQQSNYLRANCHYV
ncbi:MAG: hypothetical protein BroJett014_24070 [Planctomycetota bacterium]|nr:MAG: hypothetical protein BroJett014_24070 [Planctomycetota bacterium]